MTRQSRHLGLAALLAVTAGITHAFVAKAGAKARYAVAVNTTTGVFSGSAGTARNSADANQYVYCGLAAGPGILIGLCAAHDASATTQTVTCTTTNSDIIGPIRAMSSDSYVRVTWDPSSGSCTSVSVTNGSNYDPKEP